MKVPAPAPTPPPSVASVAPPVASVTPPVASVTPPVASAAPPVAPPPKRDISKLLLIILAAAACLVAVVFIALFFLRGAGPAPAPVPSGTPTPEATPRGTSAGAVALAPVPATLGIRQVDNAAFPSITFYASATDAAGQTLPNLKLDDFFLQEITGGVAQEQTLLDVKQVQGADKVSVSLVLDGSTSMAGEKIQSAKTAAHSFLSQVNFGAGDQIEVVSFGDYVYLEQDFTSDAAALSAAVDGITLTGSTAFYDGLYSALVQTYAQDGARCVIAFTDGQENASNYSMDDVIELSQSSGIPIYLVGIGEAFDYDPATMSSLAQQCFGKFYAVSTVDISAVLAQIYTDIYRQQQEYYIFTYTSSLPDAAQCERTLQLEFSGAAAYTGTTNLNFRTKALINEDFSADYRSSNFVLENSGATFITTSDLVGLSLAQLRIARNEIYARHGRQFRDPLLNQWFYSKGWYLSISPKYAPNYFDQTIHSLSKMELANADVIVKYENALMTTSDIFPRAAHSILTSYDLALSKPVLQQALAQMQTYAATPQLQQNMQAVQGAIYAANINY